MIRMTRHGWVAVVIGLLAITLVAAATAQSRAGQPRKTIRAVKANPHAPNIDGKLDDPIWQQAEFHSDFLQKIPDEGRDPSDRTEVAIAFDDDNLYIAARMYCADPNRLRMHLERRDNQGPAEQIIVSIDSYLDRRTGYGFGINTSGVRFDRYYAEDQEGGADYSFNPVWHGRTGLEANAWVAEIEIPFSQLRFTEKPEQVWGVNFNRWIPVKNEDIYWVYTPRNETGFVSRFGDLVGIRDIKPSRRIEALPYFASDARKIDGNFAANPLEDGSEFEPRLGGDLKMGLGPNLTLDATFNPDFGQVEADPADINLTAYETVFNEKRPFFTEGARMLSGIGPNYFYSRRIGGPPHDFGTGDFVTQPSNSTILGAAKITGKINSKTSIGLLTAITQHEHARNYDLEADSIYTTQVEPTTLTSVARIEQQFGKSGSTVGLMVTGLGRDLSGVERLEQRLRRTALSGGADWRIRFRNGMYQISGFAGGSHIRGSADAIARAQRSSARYYQRPDADYIDYDPARTSLTGYSTQLSISQNGGEHWRWNIAGSAESPGFELNDAGVLGRADDLDSWGYLGYMEQKPGSFYRSYYFEIQGNGNWNYGGDRQWSEGGVFGEITWKNYMNQWITIRRQFPGQDDSRTRGGPSIANEPGYSFSTGISSNWAATTKWNASVNYGVDALDGWLWSAGGSVSTRIGNRLQLSWNQRYTREDQPIWYVSTVTDAGGGAGTFGTRYVFSRLARTTVVATLRASYYFTPDLSLEVYGEPYASNARFHQHGELVAARGHEFRRYGQAEGTAIELVEDEDGYPQYYQVTDGEQSFALPFLDYGARSFRSNIVLRWEFRPGSTLFLVWQRNLYEDRDIGKTVGPKSMFDSLGADGADVVALKVAYWIPIS